MMVAGGRVSEGGQSGDREALDFFHSMLHCCILTLGSAAHLPAAAAPLLFVQTLGLCNSKSIFFSPSLSPFGLNSEILFSFGSRTINRGNV